MPDVVEWISANTTVDDIDQKIYLDMVPGLRKSGTIDAACNELSQFLLKKEVSTPLASLDESLRIAEKLLIDRRTHFVAFVILLGYSGADMHIALPSFNGKSAFQIAASLDGQLFRCIVELVTKLKVTHRLRGEQSNRSWTNEKNALLDTHEQKFVATHARFEQALFAYAYLLKHNLHDDAADDDITHSLASKRRSVCETDADLCSDGSSITSSSEESESESYEVESDSSDEDDHVEDDVFISNGGDEAVPLAMLAKEIKCDAVSTVPSKAATIEEDSSSSSSGAEDDYLSGIDDTSEDEKNEPHGTNEEGVKNEPQKETEGNKDKKFNAAQVLANGDESNNVKKDAKAGNLFKKFGASIESGFRRYKKPKPLTESKQPDTSTQKVDDNTKPKDAKSGFFKKLGTGFSRKKKPEEIKVSIDVDPTTIHPKETNNLASLEAPDAFQPERGDQSFPSNVTNKDMNESSDIGDVNEFQKDQSIDANDLNEDISSDSDDDINELQKDQSIDANDLNEDISSDSNDDINELQNDQSLDANDLNEDISSDSDDDINELQNDQSLGATDTRERHDESSDSDDNVDELQDDESKHITDAEGRTDKSSDSDETVNELQHDQSIHTLDASECISSDSDDVSRFRHEEGDQSMPSNGTKIAIDSDSSRGKGLTALVDSDDENQAITSMDESTSGTSKDHIEEEDSSRESEADENTGKNVANSQMIIDGERDKRSNPDNKLSAPEQGLEYISELNE